MPITWKHPRGSRLGRVHDTTNASTVAASSIVMTAQAQPTGLWHCLSSAMQLLPQG